jgi:hypothetical protein
MKGFLTQSEWPAGSYKLPNIPVRVAAFEDYTSAVFMNAPSAKSGHLTWAPLNESGFIDSVNQIDVNPAGQGWQLEEQFRAAFGYTQRVSELCQRLERIEVTLLEVVEKLDRRIQPQRPLWVPIESFAPEPFEVLRPIAAVITPVEDGYEAGLFDANLFSTGDSEVEAIDNLKSVILETYVDLEELGDSRLGPGPLRQWKILASLIRKVRS